MHFKRIQHTILFPELKESIRAGKPNTRARFPSLDSEIGVNSPDEGQTLETSDVLSLTVASYLIDLVVDNLLLVVLRRKSTLNEASSVQNACKESHLFIDFLICLFLSLFIIIYLSVFNYNCELTRGVFNRLLTETPSSSCL